jgi:hypothetical protein
MTAPLDATVAWLGLATRGWGLVVVAPGQQRSVAEALAARVPTRAAVALDPAWSDDEDAFLERLSDAPEGGVVFVDAAVGLEQEVALWRALNGRRDWLADRGVWVIVASHRQVARLTAHAGDLASVARRCEVVAFAPRALSEVEQAVARAELHAHYQRRFGRLDLRGFIRSEREDVSFPVEAIYQPLRASSDSRYPVVSVAPDPAAPRWLSIVDLLAARRARDPRVPHLVEAPPSPTLLVGGPGSGKSFFLRHCAIAASGAARFAGQDRPLPIYLALAALRARTVDGALVDLAVDELLEAGLAAAHLVVAEAEAGRALFLLDGLDEVGDARRAVAEQVAALAARFPACPVVVTSRPGGLAAATKDAVRLEIAPLDGPAVTALLSAWCELYEVERVGAEAAPRGRAEGEALAREVLASPAIDGLARTPLLATIIAIVHRAGVRLPEHRVELYEHMTRILVERWNQLRSQQVEASPPVRVADALRLLGPVALRLVEQGRDGAVDEDALRGMLAPELARGAVRGFVDVDSALATFRDSLGLLVEQAPQVYGFLHKTLAEFLAAHELVRTGGLSTLVATGEAFAPRWREVVLLALGIVGTVHANDRLMEQCVTGLIAAARSRRAGRSEDVPALLAGVLVDDPDLTPDLADALLDELVPAWWFDALPGEFSAFRRLRDVPGRWSEGLSKRLDAAYAAGLRMPVSDAVDVARLVLAYWQLRRVSRPRWLCEWMVRWAVSPWPSQSGYVLASGDVAIPDGLFKSWVMARLVALGLGKAFRVESGKLVELDVREVIERPFERWLPWILRFRIFEPPVEKRAALLPPLLELWREVAARDPDGPAPPASVEEAHAIYGPRPRSEPAVAAR